MACTCARFLSYLSQIRSPRAWDDGNNALSRSWEVFGEAPFLVPFLCCGVGHRSVFASPPPWSLKSALLDLLCLFPERAWSKRDRRPGDLAGPSGPRMGPLTFVLWIRRSAADRFGLESPTCDLCVSDGRWARVSSPGEAALGFPPKCEMKMCLHCVVEDPCR